MEEMTNQSDDLELDLGLGEEAEESEPAEETTESPAEEEAPADTFELGIKYNGQDMKLSRDEATTLAQKGMNYDKILNRLHELENDPVRKIFETQAAEAGLTLQEYANRMQEFREKASVQRIASDFKRENPDVSDEIAGKYAEQAYANQKARVESQNRAKQEQAARDRDAALIQEVQDFNAKYPDVKVEDLPESVIDDINAGTKLETAYLRYVTKELQKKVSNAETNARNKSKNIGSASDNVGSSGDADQFVAGLLG